MIQSGYQWENKHIHEIALPSNRLIIMIQRDIHKIVFPVGDTQILKNDKVIMIEVHHSLEFPRVSENGEA